MRWAAGSFILGLFLSLPPKSAVSAGVGETDRSRVASATALGDGKPSAVDVSDVGSFKPGIGPTSDSKSHGGCFKRMYLDKIAWWLLARTGWPPLFLRKLVGVNVRILRGSANQRDCKDSNGNCRGIPRAVYKQSASVHSGRGPEKSKKYYLQSGRNTPKGFHW